MSDQARAASRAIFRQLAAGPASKNQLMKSAGSDNRLVALGLRQLQRRGEIEKVHRGVHARHLAQRGLPIHQWRLSPAGELAAEDWALRQRVKEQGDRPRASQ